MSMKRNKMQDLTLKQKIDSYQRNQMVTGLMAPGTHKYSDTKAILENMGKLSDN